MNDLKKTPTVASFFSGAMGLDIGLEKVGLETILAVERDKHARDTIRLNSPELPLLDDVSELTGKDVHSAVNGREIDVMVGGPPCQSFSLAGKGGGINDDRGNLLLKYTQLITEVQPKYAVIENVRGLFSASMPLTKSDGEQTEPIVGGVLATVIDILNKSGYEVSFELYNSANFGSPQKRERIVILASRMGSKLPHLMPTHDEEGGFGLDKWRTFGEATAGLTQHTHVKFRPQKQKFLDMIKPGEDWRNLPSDELKRECLGRAYGTQGGNAGFLRKQRYDKPSPTLLTSPTMNSTILASPESRPFSIEEYRRLQGFPDDWMLSGPLSAQYRQVGNAVPIHLAAAVGKVILNDLYGMPQGNIPEGFKFSRYHRTSDETWANPYLNVDE